MGFSRQEYWSGLPFPSPVGHILSDLSTMTRPSWVAPGTWLSFIELDKAVVLVWWDWLVFCEYDFSVSVLWCPLATPTVLLGFLLPWAWGISSRLLQQCAVAAPYLGRGVSPHRRPSWPFFSFWFTLLCVIVSSFIHLIRTDSNAFLFMAGKYSIIYIYIYIPYLLYPFICWWTSQLLPCPSYFK